MSPHMVGVGRRLPAEVLIPPFSRGRNTRKLARFSLPTAVKQHAKAISCHRNVQQLEAGKQRGGAGTPQLYNNKSAGRSCGSLFARATPSFCRSTQHRTQTVRFRLCCLGIDKKCPRPNVLLVLRMTYPVLFYPTLEFSVVGIPPPSSIPSTLRFNTYSLQRHSSHAQPWRSPIIARLRAPPQRLSPSSESRTGTPGTHKSFAIEAKGWLIQCAHDEQ